MEEPIKERLKTKARHSTTFLKWLCLATVVGVIIGFAGVAFHLSLEWANETRKANRWMLFLLPLSGLAIIGLYRAFHMEKDTGTNFILESIRSNEIPSIKTAPLIFISTFFTHLFGGSAGREGAALQLGGSIGAQLGKILRLNEQDKRLMTMCGMSAAFSALFGTPITAAVFSMEVISVGVMYYSAIVPCVLSAVTASALAGWCGVTKSAYLVAGIPAFSFRPALMVVIFAVLCAILSRLFCFVMSRISSLYRSYLKNQYVRIVVGGILVILLSLLFGTRDYNGAGMDVIAQAFRGSVAPQAFLLKLLLTAVTLGAGYRGGEIVPSFFIGASFGNVAGPLLGLSPSFGAGLGLISVFCGVTNCPMTSLFLSIELFGMQGLLFYAISIAVSYMMSGYSGLYSAQKIVYSKFKPEFINKKVVK